MISYEAFFDELNKIAEDGSLVTKEKLKRHLLVTAPAIAIGSGIGWGTGKLVGKYLRDPKTLEAYRTLPPALRSKLPVILGGLAAGVLAHKLWLSEKRNKYIDTGK